MGGEHKECAEPSQADMLDNPPCFIVQYALKPTHICDELIL